MFFVWGHLLPIADPVDFFSGFVVVVKQQIDSAKTDCKKVGRVTTKYSSMIYLLSCNFNLALRLKEIRQAREVQVRYRKLNYYVYTYKEAEASNQRGKLENLQRF